MVKFNVIFLHPEVKNLSDMVNYFRFWNEEIISNMVWNPDNPEYVFVSEHIYNCKKYYDVFKHYYKKENRIFIFYAEEAVYPDLNIFDYVICMSKDLVCGDRVSYIPEEFFCFRTNVIGQNELSITENRIGVDIGKRRFCNFIYSNPLANPMRDQFFLQLCKYKKVDSLGMHLNNTDIEPSRENGNWLDMSIQMKSQYKFSIAIENVLFEGATTEKLLSSFRAHTVPIYWGNPNVAEDYNPKAFINCHDYNSIDEIVEKVKQIDNDDELWERIIREPWKTKEQISKTEREMDDYQSFLENIFSQDIRMAKRRPDGTWPDSYKRWFWKQNIFYQKVKRKLDILRLKYKLGKEMESILDSNSKQ